VPLVSDVTVAFKVMFELESDNPVAVPACRIVSVPFVGVTA
jgi:hypothetical protein